MISSSVQPTHGSGYPCEVFSFLNVYVCRPARLSAKYQYLYMAYIYLFIYLAGVVGRPWVGLLMILIKKKSTAILTLS